MIKMIAAVSSNGVIGKDGKIPFHYKEDLKHFKEMTMNQRIIMGRKTFESIGKILPGRENVILSSKDIEGVKTYRKLEDSFSDKCWLIGGHSVYQNGMKYANQIYLTVTPDIVEGDVFFPWINPKIFNVVHKEQFSGSKLWLYVYERDKYA